MSATPKCTSRWGHKFAGRYSKSAPRQLSQTELFWVPYSRRADVMMDARDITYERDICVRCGFTIERHIEISESPNVT